MPVAHRDIGSARQILQIAAFLLKGNLFHQRCPRDLLAKKAREHNVELVTIEETEDLPRAVADADAIVASELPEGILTCARRVQWIHVPAAGVEKVLTTEVRAANLIITNSAGTMAPEVAEHVFAMLLMISRRLDLALDAQLQCEWRAAIRRDSPPIGLSGLTLGLVGYGHIGRAVAVIARAFGMHVIALKRRPTQNGGGVDEMFPPERSVELLERADVIVSALPATPGARPFFDSAAFAKMRSTSILINVGRGSAVDEEALVEALAQRKIAGAALDVFNEEPLPPTSALWRAPRVIISPHLGGASQHVWPRIIELLFSNLELIRAGKQPINLVDRELGY